MNLLELLIALEDASVAGPWRDGDNVIVVENPSCPMSRILRRALKKHKDTLLPMLKTLGQVGLTMETITP